MEEAGKVSLLTKINYIFDKKQKGQLVLLAVLILIGGVFETLGVSMILPVVSVILSPESLHRLPGIRGQEALCLWRGGEGGPYLDLAAFPSQKPSRGS